MMRMGIRYYNPVGNSPLTSLREIEGRAELPTTMLLFAGELSPISSAPLLLAAVGLSRGGDFSLLLVLLVLLAVGGLSDCVFVAASLTLSGGAGSPVAISCSRAGP